jgi:hypothetical protein
MPGCLNVGHNEVTCADADLPVQAWCQPCQRDPELLDRQLRHMTARYNGTVTQLVRLHWLRLAALARAEHPDAVGLRVHGEVGEDGAPDQLQLVSPIDADGNQLGIHRGGRLDQDSDEHLRWIADLDGVEQPGSFDLLFTELEAPEAPTGARSVIREATLIIDQTLTEPQLRDLEARLGTDRQPRRFRSDAGEFQFPLEIPASGDPLDHPAVVYARVHELAHRVETLHHPPAEVTT